MAGRRLAQPRQGGAGVVPDGADADAENLSGRGLPAALEAPQDQHGTLSGAEPCQGLHESVLVVEVLEPSRPPRPELAPHRRLAPSRVLAAGRPTVREGVLLLGVRRRADPTAR